MKTATQDTAPRSKLQSVASTIAIALALYAALSFTHLNVIWDPAYYGDFGLSVNNLAGPFVDNIVPGSAADRAGIKVGDRVDRPQALRDRLVLSEFIAPRPGERMTISVLRGSQRRTLTLTARPLARLTTNDSLLIVLKHISMLVWLVVGLLLVLLRPTKMTWGFYLVALDVVLILGDDRFFSHPPLGLLVQIIDRIILPAGIAGFIIFCVRFPANEPAGWRRVVESLAPYLFVALAIAIAFQSIVPATTFIWPTGLLRFVDYAPLIALAGFTVGALSLVLTYFGARGLERQRLNWVVLGVLCTLVASAPELLGDVWGGGYSAFNGAVDLLYVILPLSVAYAVIRYRVMDARFVASRSLAVGVILSLIAFIVAGIDWLFSTRLPNSRLEAAAYVGVALLVGFSLNVARQSISKSIDFIFFRPWYRTQEQVGIIADAIRRATSKTDLYEPLTNLIASAFSLGSAALFERVEGAGFVRVGAHGWPPGTTWNILSDDPPAERADKRPRVVDVDALQWREPDLPPGVARPTIMLPIIVSKRVSAMLLCGAHENGTSLAPDEIRAIRRLCADAAVMYGSAVPESGRTAFFDQHTEPLGA